MLGLLAFLLDQQPVALARLAEDPRRLAAERGAGDGGVAQSQGDFVPAFGQHLDLHLGLDAHHVLFDGGGVFDLGNQGAHRRLDLGRGTGFVLGGLPQFLELLVGQEHSAALLLEDLPEFLVRDVDVLFENLAIGLLARSSERSWARAAMPEPANNAATLHEPPQKEKSNSREHFVVLTAGEKRKSETPAAIH